MRSAHYDERYFDWQRRVGEFTGAANRIKFLQFASEDLSTLDFGCGGGFMLKNLPARERRGVEINPHARKQAVENGVIAVERTDEVPDAWADLLISDNALEHTHSPLDELRKLKDKVKPGGRVVFVVPCEHLDYAYVPDDQNQHLYSWSPLAIGNLFKLAGYEVESSKAFFHKHVPYSHRLRPLFGEVLFNLACKINGYLNRRQWNEVRVLARRPLNG